MAIVLRPKGKLDLVGSSNLQQKFDQIATVSNNQKLWVIDLDAVNDINHFGLTTLMGLRREAIAKGCHLFLRHLNPYIQSMLDIAHLSEEFDILPHDTTVVGEAPINYGSKTKAKIYNTEVSIETNNHEQESKQVQSQSIGNIRKMLTQIKAKLPQEGDRE